MEDLVQPNTYKDTLHKECNTGPDSNKSPEKSHFYKQNVQLMLVKLCVCVCVCVCVCCIPIHAYLWLFQAQTCFLHFPMLK